MVILGWVSLIVLLQAGCWRIFIVCAVNTSLCSCSSVALWPFTDLSNDSQNALQTHSKKTKIPRQKNLKPTPVKLASIEDKLSGSQLLPYGGGTFIKLSHWHLNGGAHTEHRYICTVYTCLPGAAERRAATKKLEKQGSCRLCTGWVNHEEM